MTDVDWDFTAIKDYFIRRGYEFHPMPLLSDDAVSATDDVVRIVLESDGDYQVRYSAIVCEVKDLPRAADTMNTLAALVLGQWDSVTVSESTANFRVSREGVEVLFVRADVVDRAMFSVRPTL